MTFRIEADSLHRLVYNSLLFDTKSAKAWRVGDQTLLMNTSDGQVYLEDFASVDYSHNPMDNEHWIMSAEEIKLLENDLRQVTGELHLTVFADVDVLKVTTKDDGVGTYAIRYGEYAQQSELFDDGDYEQVDGKFSINPDRLRKIALLQPRDYPVDCELVDLDGILVPVIRFTKGPSVRGTYATLSKV